MKNRIAKITWASLTLVLLALVACQKATPQVEEVPIDESYLMDQVHKNTLYGIRLGDGVALDLIVSIRWKINDTELFQQQFTSIDTFNQLILHPRALELSKQTSNQFISVDSVFSTQRNQYIAGIKESLLNGLGEPGVQIREVILSDVVFPKSYTKAMEEASLRQMELERIRLQNTVDVEQAEANKRKAEADAKVAIAKAEADGRLQKIKAKMEESRRQSELAKAETQAQVEKLKIAAEAEKRKLIAKADLEKARDLKDLEVQRQREMDQLAIQKKREMEEDKIERQARFAGICTQNPAYADYLVNQQLAAQVEVAFLPTNTDPNIFTNLIKKPIAANGYSGIRTNTRIFKRRFFGSRCFSRFREAPDLFYLPLKSNKSVSHKNDTDLLT